MVLPTDWPCFASRLNWRARCNSIGSIYRCPGGGVRSMHSDASAASASAASPVLQSVPRHVPPEFACALCLGAFSRSFTAAVFYRNYTGAAAALRSLVGAGRYRAIKKIGPVQDAVPAPLLGPAEMPDEAA
jgi:hypothetical protein